MVVRGTITIAGSRPLAFVHLSEPIKREFSDANEQHPLGPSMIRRRLLAHFSLPGGSIPWRVGAIAHGKVGQSTGDLGRVHPVPGARPRAAGRPQDSDPNTNSCWHKLLYGCGRVEVRDNHQVVPADSARYI
jgi:hypothetical protein